jgi:predicted PurR-regulated permease PerM
MSPGLPRSAAAAADEIDWQRIQHILVSAICALLLLIALWLAAERVSKILLIVAMAGVLAYVAHPAVKLLEPRLSRPGATILVYLLFVVLAAALGSLLIQGLVAQLGSFAQAVPAEVDELQARLSGLERQLGAGGMISGQLAGLQQALGANRAAGILGSVGAAMTNVILTLFISLYFVLDGERIIGSIRRMVPREHQDKVLFVQNTLSHIVGAYIRGQVLMALIVSVSTGIGMFLLGVQYALLIAVAAFVFQLIPMIGPFLTGALAVTIAAFQSFSLVVWVLVYYLTVQLIESNVLGPRISGRAVGLHPAASLLALITGAELFGFWGAMLAVPVTGLVYVIATAVIHHLTGRAALKLIEPRVRQHLDRRMV